MRGIMKLRERRESGELVLFRPRLDQLIDMRHALVKLGRETDWAFLERRFGAAYEAGPGPHPGWAAHADTRSQPARKRPRTHCHRTTASVAGGEA